MPLPKDDLRVNLARCCCSLYMSAPYRSKLGGEPSYSGTSSLPRLYYLVSILSRFDKVARYGNELRSRNERAFIGCDTRRQGRWSITSTLFRCSDLPRHIPFPTLGCVMNGELHALDWTEVLWISLPDHGVEYFRSMSSSAIFE